MMQSGSQTKRAGAVPIISSGIRRGTGGRIVTEPEIYHGQWFIDTGKVYSVCGVDEDKIQLVLIEPQILTSSNTARTITVSRTQLEGKYWPVPCRRCGKSHGDMGREYDCKDCGARLCSDQVDGTHSSRLYHRVWNAPRRLGGKALGRRDRGNYIECGRVVPR